MTIEEKKAQLGGTIAMHNMMVHLPGMAGPAEAAAFVIAKKMADEGDIIMAAWFLTQCDMVLPDSMEGTLCEK